MGRRRDREIRRKTLPQFGRDLARITPICEAKRDGVERAAPFEEFLGPADIHRREMRIGIRACSTGPQEETDPQAFRFAIDLGVDFVTGAKLVLPRQFLAYRDRSRSAQPLLEIELPRLKISQVKSPKWLVSQDVDPQQVEIFARKSGQGQKSPDDRSRGGDPRVSRDFGKELVWQIAGRRAHLELGFARHDIDARLERAVGAVVGDLDREIKRDPECHGRDVEDAEQRMLRQIAENVAAKETEILRAQVCQRCPENIWPRALQPEMDLSRAAKFSFKCKR